MTPPLLCADVGATNARLSLLRAGAAGPDTTTPLHRSVTGAAELREFLAEVIETLEERPVFVGGFAGPVRNGSVRVTNWSGDDTIGSDELKGLGFRDVHLLNDLEAAAWGLAELLEGPERDEHLHR